MPPPPLPPFGGIFVQPNNLEAPLYVEIKDIPITKELVYPISAVGTKNAEKYIEKCGCEFY